MNFLGVDPGLSGGFSLLSSGREPESWKMPSSCRDLLDLLHFIREKGDVYAVIEKVHSMPRDGGRAAFTFGTNFGMLQVALVAAEISHNFATPQAWQKAFELTGKYPSKTAKKNANKAAAQRMFPRAKVIHANADSLLIARFAQMTHTNGKDMPHE